MPEIIGEPMDQEREKQMRAWLRKPEANTFRMVLNAKVRFEKERALTEAMKSDGVNGFDLKSTASLKAAQRYQTALDVVEELEKSEPPFLIPKLKP